MKNYYEILEVDRKASKEVIEKAYKALAIKYHPDLKEGADKKQSETKMIEINEAYNVLSDEARRAEYDSKLRTEQENSYGNSEFLKAENNRLKQELARLKGVNPSEITNTNTNYNYSNVTEEEFNRLLHEKINEARQKAYHDAYVDDMKRRGYHVVYHETPKQKLKKIAFVVVYILVVAIILRLPPVKNAIKEAMPFLTTNGV